MNHTELRNKAEYLLSLVSQFADSKGLSEQQAYRYINHYGGIELIDRHYGIMHTLSFADALDALTSYIKRQGGGIK